MLRGSHFFKSFFISLALIFTANIGFTQGETLESAEKLMIWQMEALKKGDYQQFVEHGNRAFKEFMDEYSFDSIKMQRKAKIKEES